MVEEKENQLFKQKHVEYIEDEEFIAFPSEEEEEEIHEVRKPRVNKAMIKAMARRSNMVRILRFLYSHREPYYLEELAKALRMNGETVKYNLKKLIDCSVVRNPATGPIDGWTKYYELVDRKTASEVIQRFFWLLGFRFARLIPLDRVMSVEELESDDRFVDLCFRYYVEYDEAKEALKKCWKVKTIYDSSYNDKIVGFKRKEQ